MQAVTGWALSSAADREVLEAARQAFIDLQAEEQQQQEEEEEEPELHLENGETDDSGDGDDEGDEDDVDDEGDED